MVKQKSNRYKIWIYAFFIVFSLLFILPFILLISISFSTEADVIADGFKFFPEHFTAEAYKHVFKMGGELINSYAITAFYAFVPTLLGIFFMALCGYALSRPNFYYKKAVTLFYTITMFFNGGLIPNYILRTQYLGMQNNISVYLFSWGISAMTIFVFRTFFAQLPISLFEAAYLDGAKEMQCVWNIVFPLSKPIIATYSLLGIIQRWNDYEVSLYYITDSKLYTLSYLLQQVLRESESLKLLQDKGLAVGDVPPYETLKFAICILAALPLIIIFPLFQKYFAKGMMIGAVKG